MGVSRLCSVELPARKSARRADATLELRRQLAKMMRIYERLAFSPIIEKVAKEELWRRIYCDMFPVT
jgi:hypothetical protein